MNLPIIKATKYDLLMNNIPVTFALDECLIVLGDTGEMFLWEPNKYAEIYANAPIDRYTKLINQITPITQNIGYTVDINGKIERPYENIGYSDRTTTSSYKYTGCGGSTCSYNDDRVSTVYLPDKIAYFYPHFECTKSIYGIWKIRYEVQPGDTLSEIAAAAGSPLETILKYNPQIENPNKIKAYDWINLVINSIVEPEKFMYEFNQRKELLKNKIVAELRYNSQKKAIDPYSRMTLKVHDKHTLCLSCGRLIHTPKIGKYKDKYCDNCGCYMPEIMFGGEL